MPKRPTSAPSIRLSYPLLLLCYLEVGIVLEMRGGWGVGRALVGAAAGARRCARGAAPTSRLLPHPQVLLWTTAVLSSASAVAAARPEDVGYLARETVSLSKWGRE